MTNEIEDRDYRDLASYIKESLKTGDGRFSDLCSLFLAYRYIKDGRKTGMIKLRNAMKRAGIEIRNNIYYHVGNSASARPYSSVSVCIWYRRNTHYRNIGQFEDELERFTAYYIQDPLKFVSEPGDSGVCYDGAKQFDIQRCRIKPGQTERTDKYRYSSQEWLWKPASVSKPYVSSYFAVRFPVKDAVPVLVPLDSGISQEALTSLLELVSELL